MCIIRDVCTHLTLEVCSMSDVCLTVGIVYACIILTCVLLYNYYIAVVFIIGHTEIYYIRALE